MRELVALLWVLEHMNRKLDRIEQAQRTAHQGENALMALGQDILDAVTAIKDSQDALANTVTKLTATVDSIVAAVDALVAAGTITPEQGAAILSTARDDKAATDAANLAAAAANQKLADELAKIAPPAPPAQ